MTRRRVVWMTSGVNIPPTNNSVNLRPQRKWRHQLRVGGSGAHAPTNSAELSINCWAILALLVFMGVRKGARISWLLNDWMIVYS